MGNSSEHYEQAGHDERHAVLWELKVLRNEIARLKHPIDSYACQRCGRATGLDVVLTDEKWAAISAAAGNLNLLCLWCVDEIAESLGIKARVSLHFAGRVICGTSQSGADEEHINRLCEREERAEAEVRQLKESLISRAELAATTIAGLEMENARLKAECDTLRAALHHRDGKAEVGRLESDA